MKFFFLGLGSIGARHVRNLYSLGERDFFAYRTGRAIAPVETECGVRRVPTLEAGLAENPDAVFVTSPTSLHVPGATEALRAGCHVFIEKPLGHSMAGVAELERLAAGSGRVVFVGYQMRFHPILTAIHKILSAGELGRPIAAHLEVGQHLAEWHPGEDPRTSFASRRDLGGGVILTLSHELDYSLWLFGPVTRVWCLGGKTSDLVLDVEDTATMLVEFASGLAATIHLDYLQRPASRSFKVLGEGGKIEWDYFASQATVYASHPHTHRAISLPPGFERNTMYLDEVRHFLAVIRGEEENRIALPSAIATLELSLAALASLEANSPVAVGNAMKP